MPIPIGYRMHHQGWYYKTETGEGPFFVTAAGVPHQGIPPKLLTDNDGTHARLRVDQGSTGFYSGLEFRTFQEFTLAAGASTTIKVVTGIDLILYDTSLFVIDGIIRIDLYAGGVASGPLTPMPVIRKNTMASAPVVASQVTLAYDGALVGGTLIDRTRIAAVASGSSQSSIGVSQGSERGVGPGTYHYVIANEGTKAATCIFKGYWEERP